MNAMLHVSTLVLGVVLLSACGGGGPGGGGSTGERAAFSGTYRYFSVAPYPGAPFFVTTYFGTVTAQTDGDLDFRISYNRAGSVDGPVLLQRGHDLAADGTLTWSRFPGPDGIDSQGGLSPAGDRGVLARIQPGEGPVLHVVLRSEGVHDDASLDGRYHWGAFSFSAPGETIAIWGGTAEFDAAGGVDLSFGTNVDGTIGIVGGPYPASYSIAATGDVAMTFDTSQLSGALAGGKEVVVLAGSTNEGGDPALLVFVRASAAASSGSLNGRYFIAGVSGDVAGYTGMTGLMEADGAGGYEVRFTRNADGVIEEDGAPSPGTYSIAADGRLVLEDGAPLEGAVSPDGRFGFLAGGTSDAWHPQLFVFCR
jgi:hypothetical protein